MVLANLQRDYVIHVDSGLCVSVQWAKAMLKNTNSSRTLSPVLC